MANAEVKPPLTVLQQPLHQVTGEQFLIGLRSALTWLQANQEQVNDLNVFPVPDGDTGSNMYLTLRSAVEEAQKVPAPQGAAAVMAAVAHGSLMGARGNSGVILSQIFRGFAAGLGGQNTIDAQTMAAGLAEAASVAYRAVMKPTEGTVLTVIREASQAARAAARETDDIRTVLTRTVAEAHAAVERTTEQLAVLRDAGVVDAGGFGLAVILEGFARAISDADDGVAPPPPEVRRSEPAVHRPGDSPARKGAAAVAANEHGWGYCTEFLVHGPGIDPDKLRDALAVMGDSALVVGDPDLVRVHIHTEDPTALITEAALHGRLSKLKVEDMTAQHHDVLDRADAAERAVPDAPRAAVAVVAVAPGAGFREIFTGLGVAAVVEGGQTMNPSIEDLLKAVQSANADAVILLPNNGNVILTAQQVNDLAGDVSVTVLPTRNVPQGIAALLALDPGVEASENMKRMAVALGTVTCVEVTTAVRDSAAADLEIKEGDVIALVDDQITQVGTAPQGVIEAVLNNIKPLPELVTVYRGEGIGEPEAKRLVKALTKRFTGVTVELHDGGQAHYPYVLSLE